MNAVYAAAFPIYRDYGWAPIKLGARTKGVDNAGRPTVPAGFTGRGGADPSGADMHAWAEAEPDGNLAIRLPDGIIGIDVDNYDGKRGGETIAEAEKCWGRRPYSPRSSSRDDDAISGIRLYRVPPGTELETIISFPELGLGGIEIIQRHHRFVVCWPSIHPEGRLYRWHGIDEQPIGEPPHPDDIPELPAGWLEALRKPEKVNGAELGSGELYNVKDALTEGEPSPRVAQRLGVALAELYSGGCRHDAAPPHVLALLRYGEQGETGVKRALLGYREAFANNVASNRTGGRVEAIGEFDDMVTSKKVAELLAQPSNTDWAYLIGNTAFDPDEGGAGEDGEGEPVDLYENAVLHELGKLRERREARRRLDAESRPALALPPIEPFATWINEPISPIRWRIEGLAPIKSRVLLSAQFKGGKTTLIGNLIRSLADNERFLDHFTVSTPAARLMLIDDELDADMLREWLRLHQICNVGAVAEVIPLRGRVASFNILDDHTREQWVRRLRDHGCDYLILDCLRPVLDTCGLSEDKDAGQFLLAFDELCSQAGVNDSTVVDHMGHSGERSRGDSRKLDWPDVLWKIVRETDDPASTRYFSAYGRGVDVHEGRLTFDPANHHLTYVGGSRGDAKVETAHVALIDLLAGCAEGKSTRAIEDALSGDHTRKAVRGAIAKAVGGGHAVVEDGPRRSKLHRIAYPCSECGMPVASQRERHESCPISSEGLFK
jgi:AAA domain/Bifunctional DNA primase/polymerase, N-terminal